MDEPKLLHIINSNTCQGLRVQKKTSKNVVRVGESVVNMDTKNYKSRKMSRNKSALGNMTNIQMNHLSLASHFKLMVLSFIPESVGLRFWACADQLT